MLYTGAKPPAPYIDHVQSATSHSSLSTILSALKRKEAWIHLSDGSVSTVGHALAAPAETGVV